MRSPLLILGLVAVFLVISFGAVILIAQDLNRPLAPPLPTLQRQPAPVQPTPVASVAPQPTPTTTAPTPASQTSGSAPTCGKTGSVKILVMGSDIGDHPDPPGADLIRLVKVDYDKKKVIIFAFPRDLWVRTPALADQRIPATKLGRVYDYAHKAAQPGSNVSDDKLKVVAGSYAMAQTLYDNFELVPEHYVTIKLSNVPKIVDALGGITVNVPTKMEGHGYTFQRGVQRFNGAMTMEYVRHITPAGEWERVARQNLVLDALRQQALTPAILPRLPDLSTQLANTVVTDLSPEQIASLICMVQQVPSNQIVQDKVRKEMVVTGAKGVMLPDLNAIRNLLKQLALLP